MALQRFVHGAVAVAVCTSLVACGSTVRRQNGVAIGGTSGGDSLSLDTSGQPVDGSTDGGSLPGGGTGTTGGGSAGSVVGGSTSGAGSGTSGTTGLGGSSAGGSSTGATSGKLAPVVVGITYPDVAAIATAFGKDASEADPQTWLQRHVDYINKTGGISGHAIKPIYYKADTNADSSQTGQEACQKFTQDNKANFVLNTGILGDTLPACLATAGVSLMQADGALTDTEDMRRLRNKLTPDGARIDRVMTGILKLATQMGKLPSGAKLGVLVTDCPWANRTYDNTVVPLAKSLGVTTVKGTHKCLENIVSDLGPITNDVQREALRFFQQGVTHVTFISDAEAFVVSRFTNQASQQGYLPKYFVTSQAYLFNDTRSDAVIKHASDALPNMTGFGTLPLLDVGPLAGAQSPGQKQAQDECRKADPKESIYAGDRGKDDGYWFNLNGVRGYCEMFFVMRAMFEANGLRFNLADVLAGYRQALGSRSSTLLAGGSFRLPADGLDGAGLLRPATWDAGRGQFVYSGPAQPIP